MGANHSNKSARSRGYQQHYTAGCRLDGGQRLEASPRQPSDPRFLNSDRDGGWSERHPCYTPSPKLPMSGGGTAACTSPTRARIQMCMPVSHLHLDEGQQLPAVAKLWQGTGEDVLQRQVWRRWRTRLGSVTPRQMCGEEQAGSTLFVPWNCLWTSDTPALIKR